MKNEGQWNAAQRQRFGQLCHPAVIAASFQPSAIGDFALRLPPEGEWLRHFWDAQNTDQAA